MLTNIFRSIRELFKFGADLNEGLPTEIREAAESKWDDELVERIRIEVRRYFKVASKLANWLTLLTCAPLLLFILYQVLGHPNRIVNLGYAVVVAAIGALAVLLLGSLVGTARSIHELPDAIYRELMGPLWRNLDILFVALSIDLFAYIFPVWNISTAFPILILLALLWLFAPWAIYVARKDEVFIKVRIGQLAVLVFAALICAASPIPMDHFQWGVQRDIVNKFRPFEQTEVTAQWKSLDWFTQEGAPNVWYSFSADRGYHLFSAPGHDPETNQELLPVSDSATKDLIVGKFREGAEAKERQGELEQQKQLADAQAQAARADADNRAKLIQEYVLADSTNAGVKEHSAVLIVLTDGQQADPTFTERISKNLGSIGLATRRSVFTPAFIASPLFHDILGGGPLSESQFHPDDFASQLLVIQVATIFSEQQPVESVAMLAADTTWDVRLISSADAHVEQHFSIKQRGAGFKQSDAEENAVERAETELRKLAPSMLSALTTER